MGIIGFAYNKISGEKKKNPSGRIELKHNITFTEVEETKVSFGNPNSGFAKIKFDFDILYGDDIGKISMSGEVVYSDTKEIIEEVIKGFKSNKNLPSNIRNLILKFVFDKSILKALQISDELNLPHPVPLTTLKTDAKKKGK